jgi:hypothetical protein
VYDPSYDPTERPASGKRRLRDLPLIGSKAYKILIAIHTRTRIDEVYVGGGGNVADACRRMSLDWIRKAVEAMVMHTKTPDDFKVEDIEAWEPVLKN